MYKVGDVLYPTNTYMKMGMSIVMDVKELKELYKKGTINFFDEKEKVYILITDFGNEVRLTEKELSDNFDILYHCEDVKERMIIQLENLRKVLEKYYFDGEE